MTRKETAAALACFMFFAAIYAWTGSPWLDDWDSVQFAFGLDEFDLSKHQPHPPGYPVYIAAGKVIHSWIEGHTRALTLLSAIAGATTVALFYFVSRRQLDLVVAAASTIVFAVGSLFWLQASMALTDMLGFFFVLLFVFVEGISPRDRKGDLARILACGLIAGISLGARPHITLIILVYWFARQYQLPAGLFERRNLVFFTALVVGFFAWFFPAAQATGGVERYIESTLGQFYWRLDKPSVSALAGGADMFYIISRIGQFTHHLAGALTSMAADHRPTIWQVIPSALILLVFSVFSWRSTNGLVTRPFIVALGFYLVMLFMLLPFENQRYYLPFTAAVGWSVPYLLHLFGERLAWKWAAFAAFFLLNFLPAILLLRILHTVPLPPAAAIEWIIANRPDSTLFSSGMSRHVKYYAPQMDRRSSSNRPKACEDFRETLAAGKPVLSNRSKYCGLAGKKLARFERDRRVHVKHARITLYEYELEN